MWRESGNVVVDVSTNRTTLPIARLQSRDPRMCMSRSRWWGKRGSHCAQRAAQRLNLVPYHCVLIILQLQRAKRRLELVNRQRPPKRRSTVGASTRVAVRLVWEPFSA
jgi:hypothetical protein